MFGMIFSLSDLPLMTEVRTHIANNYLWHEKFVLPPEVSIKTIKVHVSKFRVLLPSHSFFSTTERRHQGQARRVAPLAESARGRAHDNDSHFLLRVGAHARVPPRGPGMAEK